MSCVAEYACEYNVQSQQWQLLNAKELQTIEIFNVLLPVLEEEPMIVLKLGKDKMTLYRMNTL